MIDISCETFYVYRLIGLRNCWDVVLGERRIDSLPNISFGTKVIAHNEKEALVKGKEIYEELHKNDGDVSHVKDFMCAALSMPRFQDLNVETAATCVLQFAANLNTKFTEYCKKADGENQK